MGVSVRCGGFAVSLHFQDFHTPYSQKGMPETSTSIKQKKC